MGVLFESSGVAEKSYPRSALSDGVRNLSDLHFSIGVLAESAKISVVIPVFNEVETIEFVIDRVLNCGFDVEAIVVDDASTDGTTDLLKNFHHPRVRCFFHTVNLGKGAALRRGFAETTHPYVFVQDADLEYDPADYRTMIETLLDGR